METRAAVLGEKDFVMPFAAIGFETFEAEGRKDVLEAAERILAEGYGLVVVAESVAPVAEEVFAASADKPTPAVVVVPFTTASEGFAERSLAGVLRMATGIDITEQE